MAAFLALLFLAGQTASPAAAPPLPVNDRFTVRMNSGVVALTEHKYDRAAQEFTAASSIRRDDPQPSLLEGEALVYGNHPQHAIGPLRRALQLDPDSSQAHELLAAAYAGAEMRPERDAEIALLHQWHTDGKHAMIAHQDGFLLESFHTGLHVINTFQYFDPTPEHPAVYRFSIRDMAGMLQRFYCLNRAAAGSYELIYCGDAGGSAPATAPKPVKVYANLPDYSELRADLRTALSAAAPSRPAASR